MFNVIAINKRTREEHVKEVFRTEAEALKMCEEWGWSYDDGTTSYWLEYEEVEDEEGPADASEDCTTCPYKGEACRNQCSKIIAVYNPFLA